MPPLCPLAVALENYIHLTQTLAHAVWLLVVVLLSSASLPQVGVLDCRGSVMSGSRLSDEIQVLYV